jgi:hypothetical protein
MNSTILEGFCSSSTRFGSWTDGEHHFAACLLLFQIYHKIWRSVAMWLISIACQNECTRPVTQYTVRFFEPPHWISTMELRLG